jgi:hypothetical protein
MLATTGSKRSEALPGVATVAESGFRSSGDLVVWCRGSRAHAGGGEPPSELRTEHRADHDAQSSDRHRPAALDHGIRVGHDRLRQRNEGRAEHVLQQTEDDDLSEVCEIPQSADAPTKPLMQTRR